MASEATQVALDTSAAEAAVALMQDASGGTAVANMEDRWAALIGSPAYVAWARASSCAPDEVLAALRRCPLKPGGSIPERLPASVRSALAAFTQVRANVDELSARLSQARSLRIGEAADQALALLPEDTALHATVFVLLSGDRQGLAGERGEVTLDLLAVPSISAGALMTSLLAHELHHIALDWWRERDRPAARALAGGGPAAAAVTALHMLLSEGTANAFFTPTDPVWLRAAAPGLADVYGAEFTDAYLDRLAADKVRLPDLLRQLDGVLAMLASGQETPDAVSYVHCIAMHREDLPRPVAHFLGEAMVNAIRRRAGDDAVVAAIADLQRFVPAYQDAAEAAGLPLLRDETVASINRLWE